MSETEERLREREAELFQEIEKLKREYVERCKPIIDEIQRIRDSQGPPPLESNGKVYKYVGPLPSYLFPEER